jgi:hypothetical protein
VTDLSSVELLLLISFSFLKGFLRNDMLAKVEVSGCRAVEVSSCRALKLSSCRACLDGGVGRQSSNYLKAADGGLDGGCKQLINEVGRIPGPLINIRCAKFRSWLRRSGLCDAGFAGRKIRVAAKNSTCTTGGREKEELS